MSSPATSVAHTGNRTGVSSLFIVIMIIMIVNIRKDQTPGALEVGDHALQLVVRESGQGGWNALKEGENIIINIIVSFTISISIIIYRCPNSERPAEEGSCNSEPCPRLVIVFIVIDIVTAI